MKLNTEILIIHFILWYTNLNLFAASYVIYIVQKVIQSNLKPIFSDIIGWN